MSDTGSRTEDEPIHESIYIIDCFIDRSIDRSIAHVINPKFINFYVRFYVKSVRNCSANLPIDIFAVADSSVLGTFSETRVLLRHEHIIGRTVCVIIDNTSQQIRGWQFSSC